MFTLSGYNIKPVIVIVNDEDIERPVTFDSLQDMYEAEFKVSGKVKRWVEFLFSYYNVPIIKILTVSTYHHLSRDYKYNDLIGVYCGREYVSDILDWAAENRYYLNLDGVQLND